MVKENKPMIFKGRVEWMRHVAKMYYMGRIVLTEPSEIEFTAGQYAIFHIGPPKSNHTLSIATSPQKKDEIEIIQGTAPGGQGSIWIMNLAEGDEVSFTAPLGFFIVNKESEKKKVFIATGCGIAPIRSMINDYLETGGASKVMLYWGLRYKDDVFLKDELDELKAKYTNFGYSITFSKEEDACKSESGRVTDHVVQEEKNLKISDIYVCGNRDMVVDIKEQLLLAGVPKDQIYTEQY